MPTDGETLKEVDEFIGFEYFIIKHTLQILKEFIAEDLSSEDKVLKGFIEEYL